MKIAFSTDGGDLDSLLDDRFGRCQNFLLVDSETLDFKVQGNTQNLNAAQGAGIQSAQHVIDLGADILITVHCGPKAFKVLNAAGIPVYLGKSLTIRELVKAYMNKELEQLQSADVEGHW